MNDNSRCIHCALDVKAMHDAIDELIALAGANYDGYCIVRTDRHELFIIARKLDKLLTLLMANTGNQNVAIGSSAMAANTSGNDNKVMP